MSKDWLTTPMEPQDAKAGFVSGVHALDQFFERHAWSNHQRGLGRCYVWRGDATQNQPAILGFYTLSMSKLDHPALRAALGGGLPRYPIPLALLGRLAVHQEAQGIGAGGRLLRDALLRAWEAAEIVGCAGIMVDAKDERAMKFYERHSFLAMEDEGWPRPMLLAFRTLAKARGLA